jgi:predicted MFS family arabinose efflux permease
MFDLPRYAIYMIGAGALLGGLTAELQQGHYMSAGWCLIALSWCAHAWRLAYRWESRYGNSTTNFKE